MQIMLISALNVMNFIIATNNEKKLVELKRILDPFNINVITAKQANIDLSKVEETGKTFEENAKIKAISAMKLSGMPAIGDDSGLMVDALNGEPGIYSARYAGEGATDDQKISKLLSNMKDVKDDDRSAKFVCAICCVFPDGREITARGECFGKIGFEKHGENGFGYDPIFITQSGKTFAELNFKEKDEISHRGNALRRFEKELKEILN